MQLPAMRIAASLLLLAHAMFGCVWCHGAHRVEPESLVAAEEGCCDSHDASPCQRGPEDPARPCPAHKACQVRCIYLPTESVQVDHPLPMHGFAECLLADLISVEGGSAAHVALSRSDGPPEAGSLPRHLLFQLLLI
jgi:hypothetical protein